MTMGSGIPRGAGSLTGSARVTSLTWWSVVRADRIVTTSSSSGDVKFSSMCASGYSRASSRLIRRARRTRAARDGAAWPPPKPSGRAGRPTRQRPAMYPQSGRPASLAALQFVGAGNLRHQSIFMNHAPGAVTPLNWSGSAMPSASGRSGGAFLRVGR